MDVLTDVLGVMQLRSSVYCRSELSGSWSLHFRPMPCAVFHALTKGEGFVRLDGLEQNIPLRAGDLLMIPQGQSHTLANDPDRVSRRDIPIDRYGECALLRWSDDPDSVLLCGTFDLVHRQHPLLGLLPPLIHIPTDDPQAAPLQAILELMALEAEHEGLGRQTVLRRLADVLFVQMVRHWVQHQSQQNQGWLAALHDPQVSKALNLMHSDLRHQWTVAGLADAVSRSRSSFAAKFTALVGEPPLSYLTRWRIFTASKLLRDTFLPMQEVAEQVGYTSEVAFSKAFKREWGKAPGAYRREVRGALE
jgi:AraC-like DNA-binding protein